MFGISGGEFIVIIVIAAFVLGPKNVAQAVVGFRKLIDKIRTWSAQIRKDTTVDLGSLGFDSSDVEKLRNLKLSDYDPREMVRQAVQEEMSEWMKATSGGGAMANPHAAGAQNNAHAAPLRSQATSQQSQPNYLAGGQDNRGAAPAPSPSPAVASTPVNQTSVATSPAVAPTPAAPTPVASTPVNQTPVNQTPVNQTPTNEVQSDGPLDLHTILNRPDLGGSR